MCSSPADDDDDEKSTILRQFSKAMDGLKEKILNTYESKLKKGVKYFTKNLKNYQNKIFHPWRNLLLTLEKRYRSPKKVGKRKRSGY